MAKIDGIEIPTLLFDEQASAPTTPGTGLWRLYLKSDGLYIIDDAGNETGPLGAGSSSTPIGATVRRTTTQSVANNTLVAISFDTEDFDDGGVADLGTNATRLTVPTGEGGWYVVEAGCEFAADSTGSRDIGLRVNGTNYKTFKRDDAVGAASANSGLETARIIKLAAGDYVEAMVRQQSGGALNLVVSGNESGPRLSMVKYG
jgi:hypothetical protein